MRQLLHTTRGRWLFGVIAGGLLTGALLLAQQDHLTVAVYNDTDLPWAEATVWVGQEARPLPPLQPREVGMGVFSSVAAPSNLRITVAGGTQMEWNAPYLARPDSKSITVHMHSQAEVEATTDDRLIPKILQMLE